MGGVRLLVSLLLGLMFLAAIAAPAAAQTPTPGHSSTADDVNRVASNLYCPVCENEPLDVCQTSACVQWKAQIAQFLDEGKTDAEIMNIFVERYGLRVLAEPPASGVTLFLWIVPIGVAIAGGLYAFRVIRRLSQRTAVTPETPAPQIEDSYRDRVERELKQQL